MPSEIEMLEKFMNQYRKALMYLDENDDVTLKVKLNKSKIEVIDKEQTPKYRKSKSLVTWTDSSTNKHQSYKQQVLPKK